MCGINGIFSKEFTEEKRGVFVKKMNETLSHRGPDHEGLWSGDNITLGHRRLSIIDPSPQSNQPFFSNDKKFVIVYNGELYNYKNLKLELQRAAQGINSQPYFFNTNSDTEVVLAAFLRWGTDSLNYFNGMYAFAIYDIEQKKLFVARDRMGVKPLYYSFSDEGFVFSSEVRPILKSGIKKFKLHRNVLAEYAMYQTVYAPNTIVQGIKVLMPGNFLEIENEKVSVTEYYSTNKIISSEYSYTESCQRIRNLLSQSVQQRLVSDVPFGAFLSGGIDSSAVVGLMSEVSTEKIQTFNVSFDESEFSEAKYAQTIAKKYNTQHHEIKLSPSEFLNQLPEALSAMDHPGGDGLNTYIVSKATKNAGITMALSGIGGDELFAGYDVFKRMAELQRRAWINEIPYFARRATGYLVRKQKKSISGNKIDEILRKEAINFRSIYPISRSLFTSIELNRVVRQGDPFANINAVLNSVPQKKDYLLSAVSMAEIKTYLQNVLLRDTDQMGMAVALEIREPFLDYELFEFVISVKDDLKYPHTPKKLLVDSVSDLLPDEIVNRKKMGFTLPWQHWLKNDLRLFCEKNIVELEKKNIFTAGAINTLWEKYSEGEKTVPWSRIWHFVVLNNWIDENKLATDYD